MEYQITLDIAGNITIEAGDKSFGLQELDGLSLMMLTGTLKEALHKVEVRQGKPAEPKKEKKARKSKKGNGGKVYLYQGQEYASKTELGRLLSPDAKYPHKAVDSALKSGEVEEKSPLRQQQGLGLEAD